MGGHIIFKLPAGRIPFHLLDLFDRGIAIERDQGLVQVQVAAFATEQSSRYLLTAIRSKVRPRKYGEAWEERRGAMYWLVGTLHTSEWEGEARQHFYGPPPPFLPALQKSSHRSRQATVSVSTRLTERSTE